MFKVTTLASITLLLNSILISTNAFTRDLASTTPRSNSNKQLNETWDCRDPNDQWNTVIITASTNQPTNNTTKNNNVGKIDVAGVSHKTSYKVAGFDRLWQFEPLSADEKQKHNTDLQYKYAFRIKPNGIAHYFNVYDNLYGYTASYKTDEKNKENISEERTIESEMTLHCKQSGTNWNQSTRQNYTQSQTKQHQYQNQLPCLPGFFTIRLD